MLERVERNIVFAQYLPFIVLIAWVGYRQFTWTPMDHGKLWRMPGILALVGIGLLVTNKPFAIGPVDIAVLVGETIISLAIGTLIGVFARFRPATAADGSAGLEVRNGWVGLVLWLVLIGIRVGVEVWAVASGAPWAGSTGLILLLLAANRAARVLVVTQRATRRAIPSSMMVG